MSVSHIGRYEIITRVGAGGMGEVFRARDPLLDRHVAIKLLPPELASDEEARQRLFREARTAARLEHPNVCSIYEAGIDGDAVFLVMQFLDGQTVADRLAAAPLHQEDVLRIAVGVAAALSEAHRVGLVHRDIKPQNVMITGSSIKVLDFGLARFEQALRSDDQITQAGVICGTISYMSPEQLRLDALDGRSDVFGLGVMLHELTTGRRPFDRPSVASTIAAILHETPPALPASTARSAALARLVDRMLAKRAEMRPTAAESLLELESIAKLVAAEASPTVVLSAPVTASTHSAVASNVASVIFADPDQQKRYARARHLLAKRTIPSVREALEIFQHIVDADPDCAAAYAGLADCYLLLGFLQSAAPQATFPRARAAAVKASTLEPARADAHASLGYVEYLHNWDVPSAERELRLAIELDPAFATAHHWLGLVLSVSGRFEEGTRSLARAAELDPLAPIFATAIAFPLMYEDRVEDALRIYNEIVELEPSFVPVLHYRGLALQRAGRLAEAVESFDRANALAPVKIESYPSAIHALACAGRIAEARERLALMQHEAASRYVPHFFFALAHLGLGDETETWNALSLAVEQRGVRLSELHYDRRFDALNDPARFAALLERIGIAPPAAIIRASAP